jgi:hypothetical protein
MKFNSTYVILAVLLLLPGRLQTQSRIMPQYLGLTDRNSCTKIREFCRNRATELSPGNRGIALQKYMECMKFNNDIRANEVDTRRASARCDGETGDGFDFELLYHTWI